METLEATKSPNKRLKTETLTLDSPIAPSSSKGKAPITPSYSSDDDIRAQLPIQNCGICLSEGGKSVRGLIDSCDHYFCFLCIIEWSKIDSRCPLCRGRFSSIRRMRKDGSFIGNGSVRIPVRDQIYDAFGEYVDPYGQAKCSVCNGTKDECLLLLCDLCDSASHTYCVGLGATVPEDDWYCPDCDLLRAEQSDTEMDDNAGTSSYLKQTDELKNVCVDEFTSTAEAPVCIFDIVRDPTEPRRANSGTDRLLKLVSSNSTKFSSSAIVTDRPSSSSAINLPGANGNLISPSNDRESSARTLRNCRDVHKHVSVLRENWDAFRTGSLRFSTKLSCTGGKVGQKLSESAKSAKLSCQLQSTKSSQSKGQKISCEATEKERSYNVQRAWKLMNAAKSLHPVSKAKNDSMSAPKNTHNLKIDNVVSRSVFSGEKDMIFPKMRMQKPNKKVNESLAQSSRENRFSKYVPMAASASGSVCSGNKDMIFPKMGTQKPSKKVNESLPQCSGENQFSRFVQTDASASRSKYRNSIVPRSYNTTEVQAVVQVGNLNICADRKDDRASFASHANLDPYLSEISGDCHNSAPLACSQETVAGVSDVPSIKLKEKENSKILRKDGAKLTSKASKDGDAKSEILSLVKLNLKLLRKDKPLESETFKEIARLSTHTILASCGFKHKDIVRSIPTLVCAHSNQNQRLPRSALLPSSCLDCFYTFVKDVVNSILSQKVNNDAFAC